MSQPDPRAARQGGAEAGPSDGPGLPLTLPPVDPTTELAPSALPPDLLASLLADGDDELATWALRHAIAERGRARAYDDLLSGAMRLVGERWVAGEWGIAEEHLASQTTIRALDALRPPQTPETRIAPLAILTGVAGEQHMIGLVCLGHLLIEGGWNVANLGADMPGEEVARFVAEQEADLVAITASLDERLPTVRETVAAIRRAGEQTGRRVRIVLGGRLGGRPGIADELGVDCAGGSLAAVEPTIAGFRRELEATREG